MKILCTALVNTVSLALAVHIVCGSDPTLTRMAIDVAMLHLTIVMAFNAAAYVMRKE